MKRRPFFVFKLKRQLKKEMIEIIKLLIIKLQLHICKGRFSNCINQTYCSLNKYNKRMKKKNIMKILKFKCFNTVLKIINQQISQIKKIWIQILMKIFQMKTHKKIIVIKMIQIVIKLIFKIKKMILIKVQTMKIRLKI